MLKVYILIVVVGFVGGAAYGVYYYYKDTQHRIQILTENTAKLEVAKQLQDDTIHAMIEDRERFAELNKELQTKLEQANVYKDVLISKLRKHDLARLSMKRPGLVEKKINHGTAKLFRSLETMSGAPATAPAPAK